MSKREQVRMILMDYNNREYGDVVVDEICKVFGVESLAECDWCENEVPGDETVGTIDDETLCYGCDSKRLVELNG